MDFDLASWTQPADLDAPDFTNPPSAVHPPPYPEGNNNKEEFKEKESKISGLLSSLLSSGGGLDITSVLSMLDKDGKSNSMLKLVLPFLLNGGLNNLFGKKKSNEPTINLNDYKRVR